MIMYKNKSGGKPTFANDHSTLLKRRLDSSIVPPPTQERDL